MKGETLDLLENYSATAVLVLLQPLGKLSGDRSLPYSDRYLVGIPLVNRNGSW